MNPNDMLLNRPSPNIPSASSSSAPVVSNPIASSSGPTAPAQKVNGNADADIDITMAEDVDAPTTVPEKPKSRKAIEQERKDLELGELLDSMDEWKPIIPDEVMEYYLQRSGFETDDVRVTRLLALAAQRFVSSISADAFQYARTRTAAGPGGRAKEGGVGTGAGAGAKSKGRSRTVLTTEDLSAALKEYGVGADRAPYYL